MFPALRGIDRAAKSVTPAFPQAAVAKEAMPMICSA
jgi:hypothetical protein